MVVLGGGGCAFIIIDFSHVIFILSKRSREISVKLYLYHGVVRISLTRTTFAA